MLDVYISSPVSFYQREWNNKITKLLRSNNFKILLPQEITSPYTNHNKFEIYVYNKCVDWIMQSDLGLLLLPYGRDCAWEVGYYKGIGKPLFVLVDKITKENKERLRDWMVKGSVDELIFLNKQSYIEFKKDPIISLKPLTLIKNINELPSKILELFNNKYKSFPLHFLGSGAVVIKDNKVLLVEESTDSKYYLRRKGMWGFPTTIVNKTSPEQQSIASLKLETGSIGFNPKYICKQEIAHATGLFYKLESIQDNKLGQWFSINQVLSNNFNLRPTYKNVLLAAIK